MGNIVVVMIIVSISVVLVSLIGIISISVHDSIGIVIIFNNKTRTTEKTALRWVVNGKRCHAGQQEELIVRGHCTTSIFEHVYCL
jgi:hypothetical protein